MKVGFFFFSEGCPFPPTGSGLNDGQWHSIRFVAKENFAMLTVDGEEASAVQSTAALVINTGGTYHLGGEGQCRAPLTFLCLRCPRSSGSKSKGIHSVV